MLYFHHVGFSSEHFLRGFLAKLTMYMIYSLPQPKEVQLIYLPSEY
jgi:hypothetical protein